MLDQMVEECHVRVIAFAINVEDITDGFHALTSETIDSIKEKINRINTKGAIKIKRTNLVV